MKTRILTALVMVTLGAVTISGCAAQPELDGSVAGDLQSSVLLVATSAAEDDTASALEQLDALQKELDAAVADGSVAQERATTIQSAIDLVRADLDAIEAAAADAKAEADAAAAAEAQAAEDAKAAEEQRLADEKRAAEEAAKPGKGKGKPDKKPGKP